MKTKSKFSYLGCHDDFLIRSLVPCCEDSKMVLAWQVALWMRLLFPLTARLAFNESGVYLASNTLREAFM